MAKMTLDVKAKFDFSKLKLDLSKDINIAAQTVVQDIKNANKNNMTIQYKPIKPLSPKTIMIKSKKGYDTPGRALYATGRMVGAGSKPQVGGRGPYLKKRATTSDQTAEISPSEDRIEIGSIHQVGDPGRNLPARPWFGISTVAEKRIEFAFKSKLARIIRNV